MRMCSGFNSRQINNNGVTKFKKSMLLHGWAPTQTVSGLIVNKEFLIGEGVAEIDIDTQSELLRRDANLFEAAPQPQRALSETETKLLDTDSDSYLYLFDGQHRSVLSQRALLQFEAPS